ncbi:hypothetical protein NHQ30_010049 [Ciborinia camelliae]|nr:hypothetical protein NHQ30_010049 [Ciborinia camelliae]
MHRFSHSRPTPIHTKCHPSSAPDRTSAPHYPNTLAPDERCGWISHYNHAIEIHWSNETEIPPAKSKYFVETICAEAATRDDKFYTYIFIRKTIHSTTRVGPKGNKVHIECEPHITADFSYHNTKGVRKDGTPIERPPARPAHIYVQDGILETFPGCGITKCEIFDPKNWSTQEWNRHYGILTLRGLFVLAE